MSAVEVGMAPLPRQRLGVVARGFPWSTWERRQASRQAVIVVAPTNPKAGGENLRDWMEAHHPKLVGLWDWPAYRLFGRCFVCGRLIVLHSPWRLFICERIPLPIEITEQGRERLAEAARTQFVA